MGHTAVNDCGYQLLSGGAESGALNNKLIVNGGTTLTCIAIDCGAPGLNGQIRFSTMGAIVAQNFLSCVEIELSTGIWARYQTASADLFGSAFDPGSGFNIATWLWNTTDHSGIWITPFSGGVDSDGVIRRVNFLL
jgi:hypothetical protein